MSRTRIKICGLTREEDVAAAVGAGADAIGLVFYPPSRRALSPARAAELRRLVPPFVDVVALFVNASDAQVREVLDVVRPDLLQFHGDETPQQCERHGHRYLRAFRVGGPGMETSQALLKSCLQYGSAAGWLFDSHSDGYGGSGRVFDWSLVSSESARPVVLSGGLHAANVAAAIESVRPFAVDVSSGVEESPGIKSAAKIAQFVAQVRQADGY
ncbi:phosphoribosylanthranilate isomerase [Pigmentiphaga sp. GD03639]|uniref:N-(5'-phosphoribosyl)anthranilate isomerase n=1 Tax=Pigmentiphaga daeguensis TaxID=414049 RepID=A0ABP3MJB7_9BURK|nr:MULTISPECIES: phosphoribosylanthranilate isomerase [unclassified Pigmentiphaga]MDH2235833.1 phosphoribosylanthranilate isomerase [Pigmentiphaga sp. GD03639]OVZ62952.1 N-(5'-phosphoribosyl)anthranilate isomerase [Pigmentiphaga sp. NML030171]